MFSIHMTIPCISLYVAINKSVHFFQMHICFTNLTYHTFTRDKTETTHPQLCKVKHKGIDFPYLFMLPMYSVK